MEKESNHRRHGLLLLQKKDFLLQDTVIREEMKICGLKTQLVLNGLTRPVLHRYWKPYWGTCECLVVNLALFGHDMCSKLHFLCILYYVILFLIAPLLRHLFLLCGRSSSMRWRGTREESVWSLTTVTSNAVDYGTETEQTLTKVSVNNTLEQTIHQSHTLGMCISITHKCDTHLNA